MKILGIVNITEDSFSDGGRFLTSDAAIAHARNLTQHADILDLGAASSNPDAKAVAPDVEIERLSPVVAALKAQGIVISIDSFAPEVQRWALAQEVDYLNDIQGFPDAALYPAIAASSAKLIVMHSVQQSGKATRVNVSSSEILDRIHRFFEERVAALTKAGIELSRLILDPGMGFFLGSDPLTSIEVLRNLPELKRAFELPLLVSVSRKSFLRKITGATLQDACPASLTAELFAVLQGADLIRTHDPGALRQGIKVWAGLSGRNP